MLHKISWAIPLRIVETTAESRFLELPRETKIGSINREVREIKGEIGEKYVQGKRKLVREIERFDKSGFYCN